MQIVKFPVQPGCADGPDGKPRSPAPDNGPEADVPNGQSVGDPTDRSAAHPKSQKPAPTAAPKKKKRRRRRKIKRPKTLSPAAVLARSLDPAHIPAPSPAQILASALDQLSPAIPRARPQGRPQQPEQPPPIVPIDPAPKQPPGADGVFWDVWMQHQDYLRRHSLRLMSGNPADAEDALSAAMLKAFHAFAEGVILNDKAWLTRLVHNACMDQHRSNRRLSEFSEDTMGEDLPIDTPVAPAPERSPEDAAMTRELFRDLQDELLDLPATLLEPLVMRCILNMSYQDIADRLDLTNAAVRKRIQLARQRLRQADVW